MKNKSDKELFFERMHSIGGMPLNEHQVSGDVIQQAASEFPENDESPSYQAKLDNIASTATKLHELIENFDELPTWVQDKITIADHNMEAIHGWINTLGHEQDEHGGLVDETSIDI